MTEVDHLLVLCCWLTCGHVFSAVAQNSEIQGPQVKIKLIPGKDDFIEDKKTTFTCQVLDAQSATTVKWLIRDRSTLIKTFLSSNFKRYRETKQQALAPGEKNTFSVIMRRDFENAELVCRTANSLEDFYRIPPVKKTNSIKGIKFGSRLQVRGQRLVLYCDVEDPERVVKDMFFRVPTVFERVVENRTLHGDWIRFSPKRDSTIIVDVAQYQGWPIQCFAVTNHEKQFTGNVMSPTTTLIVHYLEFLKATFQNSKRKIRNSETDISLGQQISLALVVSAVPEPSKSQFFVTRADWKAGVDRNWTVVESIQRRDRDRFKVLLHFAPKKSGIFKVLFESKELRANGRPIFSNSSDSFSVNVFFSHFDNRTSHWHDKTFSPRKLFTDHFLLYTRPEPRSDQLQLLLLSKEDPKVTSEVAVDNYTRIVKMVGGENLYRVEMTIIDPVTGTYVPVFRSGSLDVFGLQLRITIHAEVDKSHQGFVAVIFFILLLAIVTFFIYRKKRAFKKVKRNVQVQIICTYSFGKWHIFDSHLSWSQNLVQKRLIHKRIAAVVKVEVNGFFVNHPDQSKPRDQDILTFVAPKAVRLLIVGRDSRDVIRQETMKLERTDLTWGAVMHRAEDLLGKEYPILEDCTAFAFGRYYDKDDPDKLAIRIYEDYNPSYRDERTLKEVARSDTQKYFWKFMTPSSTFRWPQGIVYPEGKKIDGWPVVELRIKSKHWLWCPNTTAVNASSQRDPLLDDADASAANYKPFSDEASPDVVAFLQLLADNANNHYIRLMGGEHCLRADKIFPTYNDVVKSNPHVPKDGWTSEILFLKANTEFPHWAVPPDKRAIVFVREGVDLKINVEERKFEVLKDDQRLGESEWTAHWKGDDFQKEFNEVIRRPMRQTTENSCNA